MGMPTKHEIRKSLCNGPDFAGRLSGAIFMRQAGPHRPGVRTLAFHASNRGSIPLEGIWKITLDTKDRSE